MISVANPVLFLLGIGVGLGHLVDHGHSAALGRRLLLRLLRAGAARGLRDADRLHRGWRPRRRGRRLDRRLPQAATTPLEPSEILAGHLLFIVFRLLTSSGAFVAVMALFGVAAGWWVLAACRPRSSPGWPSPLRSPPGRWARGHREAADVFRFVLMPMYMFSGTFFALDQLPRGVRLVASALPLSQGVALCRSLSLGTASLAGVAARTALPAGLRRGGHRRGARHLPAAVAPVIATGWTVRRTGSLVERNALIYRRSLTPVLSSIVEPVLYLLSIGFGVGALVGKVPALTCATPSSSLPRSCHHGDERGLQPDVLRRLHPYQDRPRATTRSCRRRCRSPTSRSARSLSAVHRAACSPPSDSWS